MTDRFVEWKKFGDLRLNGIMHKTWNNDIITQQFTNARFELMHHFDLNVRYSYNVRTASDSVRSYYKKIVIPFQTVLYVTYST